MLIASFLGRGASRVYEGVGCSTWSAVKWLLQLTGALMLSACVAQEVKQSESAPARVGIVNHTGNFIYSATVDGSGGGTMSAWGAGIANICCASIPRVWYPGMKVRIEWDMPEGRKHVIKEKVVEVEKYDELGSIYIHIFPNDEVRVVVSRYPGYGSAHPIPRPRNPNEIRGQR